MILSQGGWEFMADIMKEIVWVCLNYSDHSQFCFQTTLNPTILKRYGILLKENCIPCLDKKYYINREMVYKQFELADDITVKIIEKPVYTDALSNKLKDFI